MRFPRPAAAAAAAVALLAVAPLGATGAAPAAAAQRAPSPFPQWRPDLTSSAYADNVTSRGGELTLVDRHRHPAREPGSRGSGSYVTPPHRVDRPVDRVLVRTAGAVPAGAAVEIEVRGTRQDGAWGEWAPQPVGGAAVLDGSTRQVQVRLTLRAGAGGVPRVTGATVTAELRPGARPAPAPRDRTWRLYATREGLVGYTTANGHVIRKHDHFVGLPSRRSLSPKGTRHYVVRVCNPRNGRCETAPVWDVGPWNTTDDFWNPRSVRQSWRDLHRGVPEAQAAYKRGYHHGKDQYGRTVTNPAGIDLADGTFWDGLRMRDNGYVTVTFRWL